MQIKRRYGDACTFLGWLSGERDKVDKCKGVVKLAEDGDIVIVTSALTLTEVVWIKKHKRLTEDTESTIKRFFEQDFIAVRTVDRVIAEQARQLVWKYNVKPKDSLHVATALQLKITVMDTFDVGLSKLSGKLGKPKLRIGPPDISHQEVLELEKQVQRKDNKA